MTALDKVMEPKKSYNDFSDMELLEHFYDDIAASNNQTGKWTQKEYDTFLEASEDNTALEKVMEQSNSNDDVFDMEFLEDSYDDITATKEHDTFLKASGDNIPLEKVMDQSNSNDDVFDMEFLEDSYDDITATKEHDTFLKASGDNIPLEKVMEQSNSNDDVFDMEFLEDSYNDITASITDNNYNKWTLFEHYTFLDAFMKFGKVFNCSYPCYRLSFSFIFYVP
jgi:hypothetical protein